METAKMNRKFGIDEKIVGIIGIHRLVLFMNLMGINFGIFISFFSLELGKFD
jgi:hypothetical protein